MAVEALSSWLGRLGVAALSADPVREEDIAEHLQSDERPFHIEDSKAYLRENKRRLTVANAELGRKVREHRLSQKKQKGEA